MKTKKLNHLLWKKRKLLAAILLFVMVFVNIIDLATSTAHAASPSIEYKSHVSCIGWQKAVKDGQVSGTEGRSLGDECICAKILNNCYGGGIRYRGYVIGKGFTEWYYDDHPCGTTGEGRTLTALEFQLYGEIAKYYDLEYSSHCQNIGWSKTIKSGVTGNTQGLRLEAFKLRLVKKATPSTSVTSPTSGKLNFTNLQTTYPNNSKWNSSFMNKAWQCHGFACTLGYSLSGKDPYTWKKAYNLNNVKPGDIIRFGRPHSIMVTAVNGNEITYVDCNWVGKNTVKWNQKISKNKMTSKWGSLSYVMQYPN